MAGTLSHFKFVYDLNKNLNLKNNELFMIAGQGHDLLFFVKLRDLKNFEYRCNVAKNIASEKFKVLINKWQEEIIKTSNTELEIMLYGYIAHHILDSYIHPWININCNCFFDKNDKNTWKNNGKHEMLESIIDILLVDIKNISIPKLKLSINTINSLNKLFKNIYGISNVGWMMDSGIKNIKSFIKIYRRDRLKIKKVGYKVIDLFSSENHTKYAFLSFNYSKKEKNRVKNKYLNDFNKLYNVALNESINIISEIKLNLNNKKIANITFDKSAI